jgi:hypothetical protein
MTSKHHLFLIVTQKPEMMPISDLELSQCLIELWFTHMTMDILRRC